MQETTQAYLLISGVFFGFAAVVHLSRAINGWPLVVGPVTVPIPVSWVGFFVTGALCVWAIRLATS